MSSAGKTLLRRVAQPVTRGTATAVHAQVSQVPPFFALPQAARASVTELADTVRDMVHENMRESVDGCPFDKIKATMATLSAQAPPPAAIPCVDLRSAADQAHPSLASVSHEKITDLHKLHGNSFSTKFHAESSYRVFSCDPKVASFVLTKNKCFGPVRCPDTAFTSLHDKPSIAIRSPFDLVQPMAKGTVFDITGQAWKERRACIASLFLPNDSVTMDFAETTAHMLNESQNLSKVDSQLLAYRIFAKGTLNLIFGKHCELPDEAWAKLEAAVEYFQVRYDGAHGDVAVEDRDIALFTSHIYDVCALAVEWAKANPDKCTAGCGYLKMVDKGFDSFEELTATTANFVVAAAESPASGMAHMLDMVAKDDEVQRRLKEEVDAAMAKHPTMGKAFLKDLTYTEAVINEAMRLKAPATMVVREAVDTVELPMSNGEMLEVQKGDKVNLCLHALHLNADVWEDVSAFKPDRWLKDGKIQKAGGGAYLPFSAGTRGCPGKAVTIMWMKVMMALVQKDFTFTTLTPGLQEPDHCTKFVSWIPQGIPVELNRAGAAE